MKKDLAIALGTCAAALTVLAAPIFADNSASVKLDAALRLAIASQNGAAARDSFFCAAGSSRSASVKVLVKTADKGAQVQSFLAKNGGRITSRHGNIVCAAVPYDSLEDLARLGSVSYIEASKKLYKSNDIAAGSEYGTGLKDILKDYDDSLTGKGVAAAVIDSGIDTACKAFNDGNGKSRIAYFWDQNGEDSRRRPVIVTPEGDSVKYTYGSEYTAADIDKQDSEDPICTDPEGHGTHVSGTIAGRDDKYPGMAPDAELIVVGMKTTNDIYDDTDDDILAGSGTGPLLDGIQYIISRAKEMNKPLVLNISLGTCMGPHDGSTLFEQAIQADIDEHNLIACVSSGNFQNDARTAHLVIPAGKSAEISLLVPYCRPFSNISMNGSIDMWTMGNVPIDITLKGPNDASRVISYSESIDTPEDFDTYKLTCSKELGTTPNGDDRVMLTLNSDDGRGAFAGTLTLTNTSVSDAVVDLYIQRDSIGQFISYKDEGSSEEKDIPVTGTISMPGTTPGVITVGAYTARYNWLSYDGLKCHFVDIDKENQGSICYYSSCGPARSLALFKGLNAVKPDICAPGILVSQKAQGYNPSGDKVKLDDDHLVMSGTSMACPVVTGTAALILQNMPNATAADIKEIIFDSAVSDSYTGTVPNPAYGHGKLSAECLKSARIVSPKPAVTAAARDAQNGEDLIISGNGFTPSCNVYINEKLWQSGLVEFKDSSTIIAHKVFSEDSPLKAVADAVSNDAISSGTVTVTSVAVENRYGKAGQKKTVLDLSESGAPDPGSGSGPGSTSGSGTGDGNDDGTDDGTDDGPDDDANGEPEAGGNSGSGSESSGSGSSNSSGGGGGGGCFIATAAYGSYLEPEVMSLRRFRDSSLLTNAPGRYLVKQYYTYSPPAAAFIARHPSARFAARAALTPLVYSVTYPDEALAFAFVLSLTGGAVLYRRRRRTEAKTETLKSRD